MLMQQQQMIIQQQAAQEERQLKYQADSVRQQEQQTLIIQSLQQQQQAMFDALQQQQQALLADRENNTRLFSFLLQQPGQQLPALAPAPAPAPSPLPGSSTSLLSTPESSFPLSALLATGVLSEPIGMSQRPVLSSLTSPLPTGPLHFEDTPQPTVTEQQQPVVPPPVAEPALDELDATLQSVHHQIDEVTAAMGHSPSSSDFEVDGSQFVVAPSSAASGPQSPLAPDA
ncbi:uncharacterized protein LOC133925368 [Phragmites australis]|uniref:uncharacterized protein LOC133925368 n=1 Tax=Phragmites australis TaxID=29695 RepID=UPI002D78D599|nr:uncharacterized protein LOC133925368 [Phragmites australis]